MTIKSSLFALLVSATATATSAAVYVEPRVSWLDISGTPNIGDRGWTAQADEPDVVPTLVVGYELSPRVCLELRYTSVGTIDHRKFAPSSAIFPGDEVYLPYVRPYEFHQRTQLYTIAVPIRMAEHKRVTVTLTPLIVAEDSEIEVADYVYLDLPVTIQASDASVSTWPYPFAPGNNRRVLRREDGIKLRAGAEIAVRYAVTPTLAVTAHCSWLNLRSADLFTYGPGLEFRF